MRLHTWAVLLWMHSKNSLRVCRSICLTLSSLLLMPCACCACVFIKSTDPTSMRQVLEQCMQKESAITPAPKRPEEANKFWVLLEMNASLM